MNWKEISLYVVVVVLAGTAYAMFTHENTQRVELTIQRVSSDENSLVAHLRNNGDADVRVMSFQASCDCIVDVDLPVLIPINTAKDVKFEVKEKDGAKGRKTPKRQIRILTKPPLSKECILEFFVGQ